MVMRPAMASGHETCLFFPSHTGVLLLTDGRVETRGGALQPHRPAKNGFRQALAFRWGRVEEWIAAGGNRRRLVESGASTGVPKAQNHRAGDSLSARSLTGRVRRL